MPGPDELERMAREAPMDPERAEELLCRIEGLTGQLAAAFPELAADVFRNDETDLEYFLRRRRETMQPPGHKEGPSCQVTPREGLQDVAREKRDLRFA